MRSGTFLLSLFLVAACSGDAGDKASPTGDTGPTTATPPPTDADTDTDTDTDADTDTDTDVDTDTAVGSDTGQVAPTTPGFAADVAPIFAENCTPCHIGGGSSGGFMADTHADVVGPVDALSGLPYVTPGDPAASYLWAKLTDTQLAVGGSGSRMPTRDPLPQGELDLIEAWILAGALP